MTRFFLIERKGFYFGILFIFYVFSVHIWFEYVLTYVWDFICIILFVSRVLIFSNFLNGMWSIVRVNVHCIVPVKMLSNSWDFSFSLLIYRIRCKSDCSFPFCKEER